VTSGTLFVVATPIGNLADMTFRAVETLKRVDVIACEDTRTTRKLMEHYGIGVPLVSYHEHNEQSRAKDLMERLAAGQSVAIVSDAGTPLISDPGYRIVAAAAEQGVPIVAIPGASAGIAALSVSGLAADHFRFCGFLPRKAGHRRRLFEDLLQDQSTLIFYESPHRILETLGDLAELDGDRRIVVARELTKMHEEILRGTPSEILRTLRSRESQKGEFTVLVGAATAAPASAEAIPEAVAALEAAGTPRIAAIKEVARSRGLPKREVYRLVEEAADGE
jgi:16S rRNA (cytidine1402-2'-O)-methyltransferase